METKKKVETKKEIPNIKKIIFSNKASKEFLSAKLVDLEKSVFDFDDKDFEDNEVEIALLKLALGHVTLSEQKNINELLSQYN